MFDYFLSQDIYDGKVGKSSDKSYIKDIIPGQNPGPVFASIIQHLLQKLPAAAADDDDGPIRA